MFASRAASAKGFLSAGAWRGQTFASLSRDSDQGGGKRRSGMAH
jgi:hypothetical protein